MTQYKKLALGSVLFCSLVCANAQALDSANREAPLPASPRTLAVSSDEQQRQVAAAFVQERLAVWQERLNLKDWRISIVMARRDDLKPRTLGATHWDKDKKCATISVLDPADYHLPFRDVLNDLEQTVVHELVHLNLASLPRNEASRGKEERAVNNLADALLALERHR